MDATLQFIPIMIVGFAASLGLTPITRQIAMRLGVTAAPSKRNIHSNHMPLMGGMAIYVAFVISVLLFTPPDYMVELGAIDRAQDVAFCRQRHVPIAYVVFDDDHATAKEIVEYLDEHPGSHMFLGRRGDSTLRSLTLGSVSEKVVRHAHRPVTVVSE